MTQKQRSLVGLLGMLVLAGALGGAAWWSTRRDAQKHDAEEKAAAVFSFDPEAVTALTVSAKGQASVLAKGPAGWRLTQPLDVPADDEVVDSLLTRLSGLRRKSVVLEHATDLAKFGLDAPVAKLTATFPGGTAELALGAFNDYAGGQYARIDGSDAVLLLEGMQEGALARSTFELRDKRLASVDAEKVKRIEVEAAPDHYTLERRGEAWQVTAPSEELADEQMVATVLGVALNLRATEIADEHGEQLSRFGLDAPVARISITLKDGARVQVAFGQAQVGAEKREFAQSSAGSVVAQVPVGVHDKLHQTLASLEDRTLARVKADAVAAVQLEGGGEKVLLQHKVTATDAGDAIESWSMLAPKTGPARRWKLNALMHLLANLKGTAVVGHAPDDLAKFGLDAPVRTVTVQDGAGQSLAEVKLGREENGGVYATSGDGRIFSVDRARLTELYAKADDLLDATPAPK